MIWGEETQGATDQFEAKVLDPARFADPESSAVLGVGATSPAVEPVRGTTELVETAASSGKAAWRRRLAPHHRAAVKSFFSQE